MEPDAVDLVIEQWAAQRPDLEGQLEAMAVFGRLGRLAAHATKRIEAVPDRHGLGVGDMDVLFALRRCGPPFELTPTQLARTMMLSPAGVTSRVDRLERDDLVERLLDERDRRSFRVRLTDAGRALADELVTEHLANEADLLSPLTPSDRKALDRALRKLLAALEA